MGAGPPAAVGIVQRCVAVACPCGGHAAAERATGASHVPGPEGSRVTQEGGDSRGEAPRRSALLTQAQGASLGGSIQTAARPAAGSTGGSLCPAPDPARLAQPASPGRDPVPEPRNVSSLLLAWGPQPQRAPAFTCRRRALQPAHRQAARGRCPRPRPQPERSWRPGPWRPAADAAASWHLVLTRTPSCPLPQLAGVS